MKKEKKKERKKKRKKEKEEERKRGRKKERNKKREKRIGRGWLGEFYGMSTLAGYLTPNPFLCK